MGYWLGPDPGLIPGLPSWHGTVRRDASARPATARGRAGGGDAGRRCARRLSDGLLLRPGLRARPDRDQEVERIRRTIRRLDDRHHFTLVCQDFARLGQFARMDNDVFRAMKAATPGSYTFILPATKEVPRMLQHPKKKTVGVRIPDHVVARALIGLGEPLLSTPCCCRRRRSADRRLEDQGGAPPPARRGGRLRRGGRCADHSGQLVGPRARDRQGRRGEPDQVRVAAPPGERHATPSPHSFSLCAGRRPATAGPAGPAGRRRGRRATPTSRPARVR